MTRFRGDVGHDHVIRTIMEIASDSSIHFFSEGDVGN